MITNDMTAALTSIQDAFEDEDRESEAKDALDNLNRALHHLPADSPLAPVATAILELGYAIL